MLVFINGAWVVSAVSETNDTITIDGKAPSKITAFIFKLLDDFLRDLLLIMVIVGGILYVLDGDRSSSQGQSSSSGSRSKGILIWKSVIVVSLAYYVIPWVREGIDKI